MVNPSDNYTVDCHTSKLKLGDVRNYSHAPLFPDLVTMQDRVDGIGGNLNTIVVQLPLQPEFTVTT